MSVIQSDIVPVCHASGEVKNVVVVIPIGTSTQLIFYRHLDDSGWTVRQM